MLGLKEKTLVILTKRERFNYQLFDKKILGLTCVEWLIKRLRPFFKNIVLSEKANDTFQKDVCYVSWDNVTATPDQIRFGGVREKISYTNFPYVEKYLQSEIIDQLVSKGVLIHDRQGLVIDGTAQCESGAEIFSPNVIKGDTLLKSGCVIFPYCFLTDVEVGNNSIVKSTFASHCKIGSNCEVGPFAQIRPDTQIGDGCRIGNFVEVKNSRLGSGVKSAHLSYIGDAVVEDNVNVGCGVIFANYDGKNKHKTVVGKNCFLGCNANLVAPLKIGENTFVAAGTTLTDDTPPDTFAIGRVRQTNKSRRVKE